MCLLVFMPEGKVASKQSLEQASWFNDDGFGWAIRTPDRILVGKNMDFDKAYEEFMAARSSYNGDALFHLRITTQGTTDLENCHPFYVGKDELTVVAHNGMLPVYTDKEDKRSDTRVFAETLLPKRGGISFLNGDLGINHLSKWAEGSKLVFLTANPASKWRYVIINSKDGHWGKDEDDGVWFSNSSYKYTKPSYTSWRGGWDYGFSTTYTNPYKVYTPTDDDVAMVVVPEKSTTQSARREELYYEFQHHAYEIAESLIEMQHKNGDDPFKVEADYYGVAEDLLERFVRIYSPHGHDEYQATCSVCGSTTILNHLDLPATHCPVCDACLFCGAEPTEGEIDGSCCDWPLGWMMSYHPTNVVVKGGFNEQTLAATPSA